MSLRNRVPCLFVCAMVCALASTNVCAHSASDAYLTLTVDPASGSGRTGKPIVHGQWDIALRDLDFVLGLDDNGDGNIVWGELRKHQPQVASYAYSFLHAKAAAAQCRIVPTRQAVDSHADGAYAVLFFDIVCSAAAKRLTLDYKLFFAIDPSHRGIMVMRAGDRIATSLLSPDNAQIDFDL